MGIKCLTALVSIIIPLTTITMSSLLFYTIAAFNIANAGVGLLLTLILALLTSAISAALVYALYPYCNLG